MVVDQLKAQWQHFRCVTHEILNILGSDTGFASESLHHYDQHDGTQITARVVVFTERSVGGLVASIRIYSKTLPVPAGVPDHRLEEAG